MGKQDNTDTSMKCKVKSYTTYLIVSDVTGELPPLRLGMTIPMCRVYENSKAQCRDFIDEICRWAGAKPEAIEALMRELLICVATRRRQVGMKS